MSELFQFISYSPTHDVKSRALLWVAALLCFFASEELSIGQSSYINIQFGANTFVPVYSVQQSGAGVIGTVGDNWNYINNTDFGNLGTGVALKDVAGNSTGALLMANTTNGTLGAFSTGSSGSALLQSTSLANLFQGFLILGYGVSQPSGNIIIKGLTPHLGYNVYLYSCPNAERASILTMNGTAPVAVGSNDFGGSDATSLLSPNNYVVLPANADVSGTLTLHVTSDEGLSEIDINGLQIQPLSGSLPNPNSTPTVASYLDVQFSGNTFGPQYALEQLGTALIGGPYDSWNYIDSAAMNNIGTGVSLHDVNGNSTGVALKVIATNGQVGEFALGPQGVGESLKNTSLAALYEGYLVLGYGVSSPAGNMIITGLSSNTAYHLFLYGSGNAERSFSVVVNGGSPTTLGPNNLGGTDATTATSPNNYLYLTVTSDSSGTINLQMTALSGVGEIDVNGFQLQAIPTPTPAPVPVPSPTPYRAPTPSPTPVPTPTPTRHRRHAHQPATEPRFFPTPDLETEDLLDW